LTLIADMETKQTYPGLTLGERKSLTAHEAEGAAAIKRLQAKLGPSWTIAADWNSIFTSTKANRPGDFADVGCIYTKLFKNIADEADTFDAQVVEVLNKQVGDNKVYRISYGETPKSSDWKNGGGLCAIDITANGVSILWNPDITLGYNPLYPYSASYGINNFLQNQEGDAGVSLAVSNLLKGKESAGDAAIEKVKAKFGAEWTIACDFANVIKSMKANQPDDVKWLYMVYERLYHNIADDCAKLDADEVEALNEKVGDKKVIRIVYANSANDVPSSSNGGGRCTLSFNEGLHILWNPETGCLGKNPMFPYSDKYGVKKFVLDNC